MNRKAYWGILKSFTNWKKIPIIPPLLIHDQLVTNFSKKANNFNEYFSDQCSVIDNSSKLLTDQAPYTTLLLSSIDIKESDILNILKSLDANKAHEHDDISIRMLKLSQKSILKNDQLVTNFNEKANNFNEYFSNQCSVIYNSSKLLTDQAPYTTLLLSSIDIKELDILNILKSLDANKAHEHYDIN